MLDVRCWMLVCLCRRCTFSAFALRWRKNNLWMVERVRMSAVCVICSTRLFVMVFGFPGAGQLRPDVARLRGPGGILRSRYLHFSHIQPSMAIGADVLDLRAAELQRATPGAGPDRHAQAAQT